jgi:hypothetical protein
MVSSAAGEMSEFGFKQWFASAWAIVRERWFLLMMAAFLRELISIIAAGLVFALVVDLKLWNLVIAGLTRFVVWSALQGGYLKICLNSSRKNSVGYRDLFSGLPFCLSILISTTCFWLSIVLGLVIFIVPGLILLVRCSLYGLAIVDQKSDAMPSLLTSYRMLNGFVKYVSVLLLMYCLFGTIVAPFTCAIDMFFAILLCILYDRIRMHEANP